MGEYILRPRSHNYESGHEYDDANHKTNLAYDTDLETYWLATTSGGWGSSRTLYNFDFSNIPNGENIIGAKLFATYISDWGYTQYQLTKAINISAPSYSDSLGTVWQPPYTPKGQIKTQTLDLGAESTAMNPLVYIKNNISSLRAGSAVFGVWIYPSASSSSPYKLYDISLTVYTEDSTKLFLGETHVASAYLGNTKLTGIYLGNTKIL